MTAVLGLLNTLRRVPAWAWGIVALCGMVFTGVQAGRSYLTNVRAEARAQTLAEGTALEDLSLRWQRELFTKKLDSARTEAERLRDSVKVQVRVVNRWVPMIPDSLRTIPIVDSLVRACTRLARDCDSLRVVSARVDTLIDTVRVIDEASRRNAQLQLVKKDDRIRVLEARTCRVPAAVGTAIGVGLGFAIGRRP